MEPRFLDNDTVKNYQMKMFDKEFYSQIKDVLKEVKPELVMTRCGGAVSIDYIASLDKDQCANETRNFLRHDFDFRYYIDENKTRMRNVVNKTKDFEEGAVRLKVNKNQKMMNPPACVNEIKQNLRKIKKS